jgi:hypothetical protein
LKIDSLHLWVIVFKTEFPGLECWQANGMDPFQCWRRCGV